MCKVRRAAVLLVLLVALLFAQSASAAVTLGDGGFEMGRPNPYWTESSTNLWALIIYGPGAAHTGNYYVWMGNCNGCGEVASITQTFKMPKNGQVILSFWLRIAAYDPAGGDKLKVLVDGNKLLTIQETDTSYHSGYAPVLVGLSDYTDGGTHTLKIQATDKVGGSTSWYLDNVRLTLSAIWNNSMEVDSNNDNVPDGWKIVSPSGQSRRVCNEAYTGSCSVRLRGTGGTEQLIFTYKAGPTGKVGDAFLSRGYVKGDSVPVGGWDFRIIATHLDGTTEVLYDATNPASGTFDWTEGQQIVGVSGGDYKKIRLIIEYTANSGTLWVDQCTFTGLGGPVP